MPRIRKQRLKQRKDGRFCCKYKGHQFMGWTEDEALAARDEYKRQEQLGQVYRSNVTVYEYASKWLPVAKPTVSDSTYRGLAIHLEKLTDAIGSVPIAQVTPFQIKEIYSTAYKNSSASYIQGAKQLYCALFDSAVSDGLCRRNPAREKSAKPHQGTEGSHRAITEQEREWITTLCTDHRAFPAVITMLYAGLRPPEAKALNIDKAVDTEAGTISVTEFAHVDGHNKYTITDKGKTKKATRKVPLFPPVREALDGKHGQLVPSASGKQVTVTAWRCVWRSYVFNMETAINGVEKRWYGRTKEHKKILAEGGTLPPWVEFTVVPYDLRHSFCTWCRDNGVELNTCVKWMGHADAKMILRIYDEVSDNRSKSEAERLEKTAFRMQNGMQDSEPEPGAVEEQGDTGSGAVGC